MEAYFLCVRCNSAHENIDDAAHCCANIARFYMCSGCGFKTMTPAMADNHKCEDVKNEKV